MTRAQQDPKTVVRSSALGMVAMLLTSVALVLGLDNGTRTGLRWTLLALCAVTFVYFTAQLVRARRRLAAGRATGR